MQSRRRITSSRKMSRAMGWIGGAVAVAVFASVGWHLASAQEEGEAPQVGVRGVFPLEVPIGLGFEAWEQLGGNWESWSAETAELVGKLYENESLDVAGQRAVLEQLHSRIRVMDKALADDRYQSIQGPLLDLRGRLVRRVDLADAILDSLELDPQQVGDRKLAQGREELNAALVALREDLSSVRGGSPWLEYLAADQLEKIASTNESARGGEALLREVAGKFARRDQLQGEQGEFFRRASFDRLGEAVADLQSDLQPPQPADEDALRAALTDLVDAIEEYEKTDSAPAAAAIREQVAALDGVALDDGDRITRAMRAHYINYNLQLVASESFLSRLGGESRQESGPVRDFVLGANVFGAQTTLTNAGIDLRPRQNGARFAITLDGNTHSNTSGVTQHATIFTQGNHRFWGSKEILFDGDRFVTSPAQLGVAPHNQTTGAKTGISWFPLLGSIADSVAVKEARKRKSQSEAIAASRLYNKAYPRFDSEVDRSFAEATTDMQDFNARLRRAGVYPETKLYRTTETHLQMSARVMRPDELGGDRVNHTLTPGSGLTLHAHESLLNNAFDRMDIAGRTMTEEELVAEFERFLSIIAGRDVHLDKGANEDSAKEKDPSQFVFDETDPIRVQFGEGVISLTLRTGLKRPGEEDIPTQAITVPLTYDLQGDRIVITRGTVRVSPVARPDSFTEQVARAGVMRRKLEQAIEDRTRSRTVKLEREGEAPLSLFITQLAPRNGWLTLSLK